MPGSDEGIKLGLFHGKSIGTILGNVDVITLGLDVGTYLDSLDGSFDGSNYSKIWVLLIVDSLGSTDGKVIGSDECIKLGSTDGKFLGTILGNVDGIILGLDVGTELVYLDGSFDNIHWLLWCPKSRLLYLIFVSDPYLIYVEDPC